MCCSVCLEDVEGELCLLEVMRCVLLCIPEAVEGGLRLLEVLEVSEVLEVMRCVLRMLEAVEGGLCLRSAADGGGDTPRATLYAQRPWRVTSVRWRCLR